LVVAVVQMHQSSLFRMKRMTVMFWMMQIMVVQEELVAVPLQVVQLSRRLRMMMKRVVVITREEREIRNLDVDFSRQMMNKHILCGCDTRIINPLHRSLPLLFLPFLSWLSPQLFNFVKSEKKCA
uniref:Secreted protein n=1 Tax=Gongylonema pulchrum TaxID=637853 RepID=A0A183D7C1_9BILA